MKPKTKLTEEEFMGLGQDHLLNDAYEKQADGTYLLQLESTDGRTLEDASGLRSALSTERQARKDADKLLGRFKDLDPDAARDALKRIGELGDNPNNEEKQRAALDALRQELTTKHARELGGKDTEVKDLTSQLEDHLLRRQALQSLSAHKGNSQLLLPHVVAQMAMVKDAQGRYVSRVINPDKSERVTHKTGSTDPMEADELVELMKADPVFQGAFEGVDASGGDVTSGGKPPVKGGVMQIKRTDQEAINENWQKVASGEAVIVD